MDRALVGTAERVNRYRDPQLDRAMGRLAASGVEVWTREIAARVSRIPLEEMPRFYPEVIRPGRLEGMVGHVRPGHCSHRVLVTVGVCLQAPR